MATLLRSALTRASYHGAALYWRTSSGTTKRSSGILAPMRLPHADPHRILASLAPLSHDIDGDILQDFVTRMDPDYFAAFSPQTLITHIRQARIL